MTGDPGDLDESTVRASRRRPQAPETPEDLEETVLGQRRRADHPAPELDAMDEDAMDETVLSSRPRGTSPGVSDEPDTDDTVLSSRLRESAPDGSDGPDAGDTVLSSRPRGTSPDEPLEPGADDTVLSSRPRGTSPGEPLAPDAGDTVLSSRPRGTSPGGAVPDEPEIEADDTIAVPRRRSTAHADAGGADAEDDPILRWSHAPSEDERRSPAPQRTPREGVIDDQIRRRVASTPEPAILRAPYRPRVIDTPPVNRLEPVAREPREPVNTAAADSRRRADSRRTLIAVIAVGGVIVLAGISGIVALLTGLI